jgi:hypothetical protein
VSAIPAQLARKAAPAPPAAPEHWGRLVAEGRAARAQADGGRWRIGHLADTVERRYRSGALQRFAEDIGESYGTVRRYRWVVARYEPGIRFRFPGLSFSHFQAVAGVPARVSWLERATLGAWSVDRLTRESRAGDGQAAAVPAARLRGPIGGATRSLAALESMDDATLAGAAREWLGDALDELGEAVESLQARLRRVARGRTTSLNRYKVTGGAAKRRAPAPAASGNGKAKPATPRTPVNPF